MQYLENELRRTGDPRDLERADIVASMRKSRGMDISLPSIVPIEATPIVKSPETPVEIKTLSKDQLILSEATLPQYVSDILQRAEKAGIGVFEPYHLSGVTLTKDSEVHGWDRKPEDWYWDQIQNGNVGKDAVTLPNSWILIDKTQKPDYKDGKQMYEKDPLGSIISRLRKEGKIQKVKGIPDASRFRISHDELTQTALPEIANLLGVEASDVRLPKAIEFNVIGNFKHPEWGKTNTWEWFDDSFGDGRRLVGGRSGFGGLTLVSYRWSDAHGDRIAFRPLVVVSPPKP